MRHRGLLLAALAGIIALAAACAPQAAWSDAPLRLHASVAECRVGEPFTLTVERSWARNEEPPAWDPATVQPLHLEWEDRQRAEAGGRIHERLRYRAYAFAAGTLTFPPHFNLQVRTGLPAADAGQLEAPPAASVPRRWPWIGVPCGLLLAFVLRRLLQRRVRPPAAPAPPPSAALRLQALQPEAPQFPRDLSAALRDWLAERTGSPPGRLAEELLAAETRLAPAGRESLREIVQSCQAARYGDRIWPLEARRAALAGAVAIVEEAP